MAETFKPMEKLFHKFPNGRKFSSFDVQLHDGQSIIIYKVI